MQIYRFPMKFKGPTCSVTRSKTYQMYEVLVRNFRFKCTYLELRFQLVLIFPNTHTSSDVRFLFGYVYFCILRKFQRKHSDVKTA